MPPEVVFFDAAETLMFLPRSVGTHYAEVAAQFGVRVEAGALDVAFRTAWKTMPARAITRDGAAQPDDDKGWWSALVQHAVAHAKIEVPFEDYFEAVYDHFARPGVWQAFPEVEEVLAALEHRGVRLGVISNFDRRLYANLRSLGLLARFEHITISSQVGADKPHPRIFERACALFDIEPSAGLHVGDDPVRDWQGAEKAGLRVFRLNRPENDLRGLLEIR